MYKEEKEQEKFDRQRYYGYYCEFCRKNNIEIKPYHEFTINDWFDRKTKLILQANIIWRCFKN